MSVPFVRNGTSTQFKATRRKFVHAIHAYGSGLQELEKNVMKEMESLIKRIDNIPGKEFECVAMIQRSLANVISLLLTGETVLDSDQHYHIFWKFIDSSDVFLNPRTNFIMITFPFLRFLPEIIEFDKVIGRERSPTYNDRENCTFFKAFEMEVLRYIPVVPLLLPHVCRDYVELDGYDIEGGTVVFANIWFIHHNEEIWGDPWTFRPERFLDEHGDLLPAEHKLRRNLLAFGYGLRHCPGEMFARTRYFLYISSLLQRWSFEFLEGKGRPCDPRLSENFAIKEIMRAFPFHCRVRERF